MVLNGTSALLGVAGSVTATAVGGWITPVLISVSVILIGRSFYVIYVRGIRTRATVVIAWSALVFIIVFWTWQLTTVRGSSLSRGVEVFYVRATGHDVDADGLGVLAVRLRSGP